LTLDEALDMTCVYLLADPLPPGTPLVRRQPFRAPHCTISHAGWWAVGDGSVLPPRFNSSSPRPRA